MNASLKNFKSKIPTLRSRQATTQKPTKELNQTVKVRRTRGDRKRNVGDAKPTEGGLGAVDEERGLGKACKELEIREIKLKESPIQSSHQGEEEASSSQDQFLNSSEPETLNSARLPVPSKVTELAPEIVLSTASKISPLKPTEKDMSVREYLKNYNDKNINNISCIKETHAEPLRVTSVDSFQHELVHMKNYLSQIDSAKNSGEKSSQHKFGHDESDCVSMQFDSPVKNPFEPAKDQFQTEKRVNKLATMRSSTALKANTFSRKSLNPKIKKNKYLQNLERKFNPVGARAITRTINLCPEGVQHKRHHSRTTRMSKLKSPLRGSAHIFGEKQADSKIQSIANKLKKKLGKA